MFLAHSIAAGGTDDRSAWGDFWFQPVNRAIAGQRVTASRAMYLPVVLACVRVLAESMAVPPLRIYTGVGKKRKLVEKHWLYPLFRKPNPFQTGFEWREMIQGHVALRGVGYNEIQTNRRGDIVALVPKHPDRMRVVPIGPDAFDYRYEYTDQDGKTIPFAREEIWAVRGLSDDGIRGLALSALGGEAIGLGLAAQAYGSSFFKNDAKPGGGWIKFPGKFKDKGARDQFRESWQEAQAGRNRGKVAVLEGGMEFNEIGVSNKDSQFLEARQFQVSDIARMFRVPPHLIGDLSKATFSNIEQQSLDFVIHCMTPWAERWESSIETWLLLEDDEAFDPEFDFSRYMRGDKVARAAYYHAGILDGWMVRNEARLAEGLEPIDGLDEPLRPLNMVEESEAEAVDQAPPATPADDPPPPAPDENARAARELVAAVDRDHRARFETIIRGNAARMARRIFGTRPPTALVLAEAMAVPLDQAEAFLEASCNGRTEAELTSRLLILAGVKPA